MTGRIFTTSRAEWSLSRPTARRHFNRAMQRSRRRMLAQVHRVARQPLRVRTPRGPMSQPVITLPAVVAWQEEINAMQTGERFQHSNGEMPCLRWIQGQCNRGQQCHWRHYMMIEKDSMRMTMIDVPGHRRPLISERPPSAAPEERTRPSWGSRPAVRSRSPPPRSAVSSTEPMARAADRVQRAAERTQLRVHSLERRPDILTRHIIHLARVIAGTTVTLQEGLGRDDSRSHSRRRF